MFFIHVGFASGCFAENQDFEVIESGFSTSVFDSVRNVRSKLDRFMPSQTRMKEIEELLDKSSKKLKDWVESPVRAGSAPSRPPGEQPSFIPPIVVQREPPVSDGGVELETGVEALSGSPTPEVEDDGVEFSVQTVPSHRTKPKKKEPLRGKRARSKFETIQLILHKPFFKFEFLVVKVTFDL
jgi:hypothetical protein